MQKKDSLLDQYKINQNGKKEILNIKEGQARCSDEMAGKIERTEVCCNTRLGLCPIASRKLIISTLH